MYIYICKFMRNFVVYDMYVCMYRPDWFKSEELRDIDIQEAQASWLMIVSSSGEEFLFRKRDPSFTFSSCLVWFFDVFYNRLFDVHPRYKYYILFFVYFFIYTLQLSTLVQERNLRARPVTNA